MDSGRDWQEDRRPLHGESEGRSPVVRVSARTLGGRTQTSQLQSHPYIIFIYFFIEKINSVYSFCRLINVLEPGSVRKISNSSQNWHQVTHQRHEGKKKKKHDLSC